MNLLVSFFLVFCTFLVLLMYPGLGFFYSGLSKRKNMLNTMVMCLICLFIVSIQWVLFGYTLAFHPYTEVIGNFKWSGLNGVSLTKGSIYSESVPQIIHVLYQMMFAGLAIGIAVGSVVERIRLGVFICFSFIWTTLIYDPLAHMFWAKGGFLEELGALDFAGGNVVHISAGISGLVLAIIIGKRRGGIHSVPNNMPLVFLGASLLYIGWFGFNAGNAFAFNGTMLRVLLNTQISASFGVVVWMFLEYLILKKTTALGLVSGLLSGLVGITPGCAYVNFFSASIIGAFASVVCFIGVFYIKKKFEYDDSLDAFGIHGIGGIWGGLATGLFASDKVYLGINNGVFYGGGVLLLHQIIGILATLLFAGVGTYVIVCILKFFFKDLRVSEKAERTGLDISIHGEKAYH